MRSLASTPTPTTTDLEAFGPSVLQRLKDLLQGHPDLTVSMRLHPPPARSSLKIVTCRNPPWLAAAPDPRSRPTLILWRHRRGANANRRRRCQSLLKFSGMIVPSRQDISHITSSVLPFPVPQCPPDRPSGEMQRERPCGGSGRHLRPGEEKVAHAAGWPPPPLPNNGLTRQ